MIDLFQLRKRKQELELERRSIQQRINKAPEGKIKICCDRGKPRYYLKTTEIVKQHYNGIALRKSQNELAKAIIQKEYDLGIVTKIEEELKVIEQVIKYYDENEYETEFDKLHPCRKELIQATQLDVRAYMNWWEAQEYQGKNFSPDTPEIYTDRGERVRSKSEKIIADKLYAKGIPYQYEYPIELGSWGIVYPDFRVLNVRERKTLYWEHLGMMGQPDYVENAVMKINKYIKCGIYPGEQLILTYETASHPIDTKTVDLLINKYLL